MLTCDEYRILPIINGKLQKNNKTENGEIFLYIINNFTQYLD